MGWWVFYGVASASSNGLGLGVLGWVLEGWRLRGRLLWFGGLGLKSWIVFLVRLGLRYRLLWFGG